jgi:hypothetical protein
MRLKYSIIVFINHAGKWRKGFGALEHPTATTVVLPELMPKRISKINDGLFHMNFFIS